MFGVHGMFRDRDDRRTGCRMKKVLFEFAVEVHFSGSRA
jgi:hypothetical protein